jgi:hypothetical protein
VIGGGVLRPVPQAAAEAVKTAATITVAKPRTIIHYYSERILGVPGAESAMKPEGLRAERERPGDDWHEPA